MEADFARKSRLSRRKGVGLFVFVKKTSTVSLEVYNDFDSEVLIPIILPHPECLIYA